MGSEGEKETMTIENIVECDGCGDKVHPPKNEGYVALMVQAADGVNFTTVMGHLCRECRVELSRWISRRRQELDAAKKGRPS